MRLYSVVFKSNGKNYYFKTKEKYEVGDFVIVETEKGLQYGKINKFLEDKEEYQDYKPIIRKATEEDNEKYLKILKNNIEALKKCKELVKKLNLDMHVLDAEFTFDRSQLIFNFVADERVDFRELARKLAGIYHTRIELRQIGARDKAKLIGGIGVCGQPLCCQRFLNKMDAITMNMAKNQNLALNPSKINGGCGRLLCCLQYEDEYYEEKGKGLPDIGETIKTKNGDGEVISVDILNRKVKVLVNGNKEEIKFE